MRNDFLQDSYLAMQMASSLLSINSKPAIRMAGFLVNSSIQFSLETLASRENIEPNPGSDEIEYLIKRLYGDYSKTSWYRPLLENADKITQWNTDYFTNNDEEFSKTSITYANHIAKLLWEYCVTGRNLETQDRVTLVTGILESLGYTDDPIKVLELIPDCVTFDSDPVFDYIELAHKTLSGE